MSTEPALPTTSADTASPLPGERNFFRTIALLVYSDLVKLSHYWVIIFGYLAIVALAVVGAYLFHLIFDFAKLRTMTGWDFSINLVLRCVDLGGAIIYVMICILFALEVSNKTIKYILTRPVTRLELILSKYVTAMLMFVLAYAIFWAIALAAGAYYYGLGDFYQFDYLVFPASYLVKHIVYGTLIALIPCAAIAAMALTVSAYSSTMGGAIIIGLIFWVFFQILGLLPKELGFTFTWHGELYLFPYITFGFPSLRWVPFYIMDDLAQGQEISSWWSWETVNMTIISVFYFIIFFTASVIGVMKRDFTL
jgi:ABC-type transport system involved in multi-copper enzyme maturation permease subunit